MGSCCTELTSQSQVETPSPCLSSTDQGFTRQRQVLHHVAAELRLRRLEVPCIPHTHFSSLCLDFYHPQQTPAEAAALSSLFSFQSDIILRPP